MRTHHSLLALAIAVVAPIAAPIQTSAQCTGNAELWGTDQVITSVRSNTGIGLDFSFFAHGPVLYAIWNESGPLPVDHGAGDFRWIFTPAMGGAVAHELGHNLGLCHMGAAVLAQGPEALFVASDNGRVYKLDVLTGLPIGHVDVRRPGCPGDKVIGPPAVQLFSASNEAFQNAMLAARGQPDDLVFIVTKNGCEDHSGNQVIACYASDLTERWRFNATGSYSMDSAEDGCEVHYGMNLVYCGTNQAMPGQNTLWSIQSLSGVLLWATDAGPIVNRPLVHPEPKLHPEPKAFYLASTDGAIQKRDAASGALVWTYPTGSSIVRSISPEFRLPDPTRIYYTTSDGLLHGIVDDSPAPVPLWPPISPGGSILYTTAPAVAPALGKAYVGRSDGFVQEISLAGPIGPMEPAGNPGTVFDPSLDVSGSGASGLGAPGTDRLMVSTTEGSVRRYCIPWGSTTSVPGPSVTDESLLRQNAPNPFSTRTRIEYRLPYDARVEVAVYDIEGHQVRALARDDQPAGPHELSWNGIDDAGRTVASGIYFYRLRAVGAEGRSLERTKRVQVVR